MSNPKVYDFEAIKRIYLPEIKVEQKPNPKPVDRTPFKVQVIVPKEKILLKGKHLPVLEKAFSQPVVMPRWPFSPREEVYFRFMVEKSHGDQKSLRAAYFLERLYRSRVNNYR